VITVPVRNIGTRRSREVVQVYYRPAEHDQPVRLVGWQAVTVDPGVSATAQVATEPRMWRRWDEATGRWRRLSDGGELLIARGLGDIRTSIDLA
jgi:beta-glucosidase